MTFSRMPGNPVGIAATLGNTLGMSYVEPCDMRVAARVEVDLDGTRYSLRWPLEKNLVETMLDAGIEVPHSCREGHCGSCVASVISGQVEMAVCDILEPEDLADGLILGCQAHPVSDDVHIEY